MTNEKIKQILSQPDYEVKGNKIFRTTQLSGKVEVKVNGYNQIPLVETGQVAVLVSHPQVMGVLGFGIVVEQKVKVGFLSETGDIEEVLKKIDSNAELQKLKKEKVMEAIDFGVSKITDKEIEDAIKPKKKMGRKPKGKSNKAKTRAYKKLTDTDIANIKSALEKTPDNYYQIAKDLEIPYGTLYRHIQKLTTTKP